MLETKRIDSQISLAKRIEIGVVGGLIASIAMAIVMMIISSLGPQTPKFFTILPEALSFTGPSYELGITGLILHLLIGVVWGLIFSLALRSHSITRGLGLAAVQLIILAITFTTVPIPSYGGSLIEIPVLDAARFIGLYGLTLAVYGAVLGLVVKKYI